MIASDIADYLASQGLGTVATNIFVDSLPSTPDTALAVFTYNGQPGDHRLGYDGLGVQVRTRSTNPQTAWDNLMTAYGHLQSLGGVTLGASRVVNCLASVGPANLGKDEAGRQEYTYSFQVEIRNQTTHRE